jgi:hypothetical protein
MTEPVTASHSRRIVLAIVGLLAIGAGGWLSLHFIAPVDQPSTQEASREQMKVAETASRPSAPPDAATSLLGTASSISPDELTLVLVATSPGRTPRDGTASLGTDPRNPQTYAAGASLVNGAVLAEIHADHVVL